MAVGIAATILVSCAKTADQSEGAIDTMTVASALVRGTVSVESANHAADTALLAQAEDSRVDQVRSGDSSALVWSIRAPTGWGSIWRSSDLLGAQAAAKLQDVNGDGTADLFWSIAYEGLVGAMVVLRSNDGITELFPDVRHCLRPELQTVGHRQLIVVYLSGAFSPEECEEPFTSVCLTRFQIVWPQFFQVEGKTLIETRREPAFYRDLSERYRRDAAELQRLVDAESGVDEAKQVYRGCPPKTLQRMRKLADSARSLAD